ncbi:PIN domain-containing protein [Kitasatospora sp. P5_F3]
MARGRVTDSGTLVLDSQGLSKYIDGDPYVGRLARGAVERGSARVVSGSTLIEVQHRGIKRAHWDFVLSQLQVEPLHVEWAREAATLLQDVGLHGHKYAIDAMVAVTALHQPGPVVMLTSDVDDMAKLCGDRVTLIAL